MKGKNGRALMLHSVGQTTSNWLRKYLTCDLEQFEYLVKYLAKKYNVMPIKEYHEKGSARDKKDVLLTFDDGYLDNWMLALPILEKYKLQSTVFVNPEFVDKNSEQMRPQFSGPSKKWMSEYQAESLGFMNQKELLACDGSGYMNVESHSMSHNFVFSSDEIVDFYEGQEKYDWLFWLLFPDEKPNYLNENLRNRIPRGYPIFPTDRALRVKTFKPSENLIDHCLKTYNPESKSSLLKEVNQWKKEERGAYESNEDQKARYSYELFDSKNFFEKLLKRPVDFLCWPGGGYNDLSMNLAIEAGYVATTFSEKNLVSKNTERIDTIKREGYGSISTLFNPPKPIQYKHYLIDMFEAKNGSLPHKVKVKILKKFI